MKLYFLRHGQANRSAWTGTDFERPLTQEGRENMIKEADTIHRLDLQLDAIITSPLVRARQTAEIVANRLNIPNLFVVDERLEPGFGPSDLEEIFGDYNQANEIMLVGHEPDFSETIRYLIGGGNILCKKGGLARVDLTNTRQLAGELVWLIPPSVLLR